MNSRAISEQLRTLCADKDQRPMSARLRAVIDDVETTLDAGVPQAVVLEVLKRHGIDMSLMTFRTTLKRIRNELKRISPAEPGSGHKVSAFTMNGSTVPAVCPRRSKIWHGKSSQANFWRDRGILIRRVQKPPALVRLIDFAGHFMPLRLAGTLLYLLSSARKNQMLTPLLTRQRALITGASSGIGEGIAQAFARHGASVVINFHSDRDQADAVAAQIQASGGQAVAIQADISNPEECARLFQQTEQALGGLDIVVANAGIQRDAPFAEMSLNDWQQVIDVNLTGQFLCAQHAVRIFEQQEPDKSRSCARGKILFTSSVHQVIPWAGRVNYAASKGGLKLLMESLAQEVANRKIRVNAIAPGAIKTSINTEAWNSEAAESALLKLIPYGRIGLPEDVANAAVWLASDESDYVVGTTLFVDGGMLLYPAFRDGG